LGITGGAYITSLPTAAAQFSGLGGAIGIGQAVYGLDDPGANAKYAAPTGRLGSGAGLYNEGAGVAPGPFGGDQRVAGSETFVDRNQLTPEQRDAMDKGTLISSSVILAPGVGSAARAVLGWIMARWGMAAASGEHIVLGLRNFGLEATAAQVGGRTLLKDPNWMTTLRDAISVPATRFTVSLRGLSGASPYEKVMNAVQQGIGPRASPLNWELAQLYQAGRMHAVKFLDDAGKLVSNPF
jgi:hypothetical protein